MIHPYRGNAPKIAPTAYVQSTATIVGDVEIADEASVWFHVVVRGDVNAVRIGPRSNVQDLSVVHVTRDRWPTIVGEGVTVGHRVVLHGCVVGDYALVGIGAVLLDGVEIGAEAMVGAGALVAPGTKIPPRTLALGAPAKPVRDLRSDELDHLHRSAANYVEYSRAYRDQGI
jgi:carbonic anhydrase/acetyltransferase-like protein (isoleucine patch superfamily)